MIPSANGRSAERTFWCALAVALTFVLLDMRDAIGEAHVALSYLLVVLGASARGGRRLGLALAFLCFLAFNFFFLPPFHTFTVHRPVDWLVLFAFLAASAVATQLLHRAQTEAGAARRRAEEIDRLATLGAETLSAARAEDAVAAVAKVIQTELGVDRCEIYLNEPPPEAVRLVAAAPPLPGGPAPDPAGEAVALAAAGAAVVEPAGSEPRVVGGWDAAAVGRLLATPARALLVPLSVRDRPVGVLRLESAAGITLHAGQRRFAEALAYYAALALERVRLAGAAEHAEALREADRLKDALLASVSHDLRTPLTSIKALAHDLAAGGDERAVAVEEEADRLGRFVSDLLDLSTLRAGDARIAPELTAAEDVLGAALQQVSAAAAGREIQASLGAGEPLLVGRFDFVHTLRALVNLLENALKYSPAGAPVEVCARRDDSWLVFEVADRGPGIPEPEREGVFEPFFRGERTAGTAGTGLGLAIARRSVELQGGSLEHAPRPGGGSIFRLQVPAAGEADLAAISS